MKFFSLCSAVMALVVVAAQDASMQMIPADLTSTLTITQMLPPTTTSAPTGVSATECATNAYCDINQPPKKVDVYPGTIIVTKTKVMPEKLTVTREVVQLVVTVTSVAIATTGLCPTEVTSVHATPLTVFVEHVSTQIDYIVETSTRKTTSILTELYTAINACTKKSSDFIFAPPTSPGAPSQPSVTSAPPAKVTIMGEQEPGQQQPMGAPASAGGDDDEL